LGYCLNFFHNIKIKAGRQRRNEEREIKQLYLQHMHSKLYLSEEGKNREKDDRQKEEDDIEMKM